MNYPDFGEFFAATHRGLEPLPWQQRLAETVISTGWPSEIGIPTGLGKSTCIDIAVWALGQSTKQTGQTRQLPTRVWYVVNRRLLVDAAYTHAQRLVRLLTKPGDLAADWDAAEPRHLDALNAVAGALRELGSLGDSAVAPPLTLTRLRGGAEIGARPPHPAQPALLFATVPMFAGNWLFRGYASSRSMRPVDAAHAGIDSLILLDEAHLARPLMSLAPAVAECDLGDPRRILPAGRARPQFVAMTATGDDTDAFELDSADFAHAIVGRRLGAAKPVRLVEVNKGAKDLAEPLVEALAGLLDTRNRTLTSVVFVNGPAHARRVFDQLDGLQKRVGPLDRVLITGRMRRREADTARSSILDPVSGAPAGRDRSLPRARHLVVVATQTLEVGADLDFDVLVTESCGRRALIQRLGRLNRLGDTPDAGAAIVHPAKETEWPVYGSEPGDLWARLVEQSTDGELDLGPGVIAGAVGEPEDAPPRVGVLLPAHLWEWAKTSMPPRGEAPVELFYDGFDDNGPRVTVCWRARRFGDGERVIPHVVTDESVDLPLHEVRQSLAETSTVDRRLWRLSPDRVTVEACTPATLRPGDIVILDSDDGLYDEHGWSPTSTSPVTDVSIERAPLLPLDSAVISHWSTPDFDLQDIVSALTDDDDADELALANAAISRLRSRLGAPEVAQAWNALVSQLRPEIRWTTNPPTAWLVRDLPERDREEQLIAADAFDDLSAAVTSVSLSDHLTSVGEIAGRIARQLGLDDALVECVEAAGRFHDLGKAEPRFQRWLHGPGPSEGGILAKSSTPWWRWSQDRAASGWPAGGRHEAISGRMVQAWIDDGRNTFIDPELVLHLVVSHHGHGRPLVPPVTDLAPGSCAWPVDGVQISVTANLAEVDWAQPARFRACCNRYGYWGVALAEAILRQADHLASRVVVA